jgi:hypothetical protein
MEKLSILIFNLSGGLTDMKKNWISIMLFTKQYNYKFTIKYCTARSQTFSDKKIDEEVIKNNYMYDVKNLFNEKTFQIIENYISFEKINHDICEENTYDFYEKYKPWEIFSNKNTLKNYKDILNEIDKKYIYVGNHFHFYAGYDVSSILYSKYFNDTIIPNDRIINEYNNFISNINDKYNFIHFRYEKDMVKFCNYINKSIEYTLEDIINLKTFRNNNLNIYIATSDIEEFYDKKLIKNPIYTHKNLFYNKHKMPYFDENAFVDFLIGINSEEILGFEYSGFSVLLNKFKNTENYYNKYFNKKIENNFT